MIGSLNAPKSVRSQYESIHSDQIGAVPTPVPEIKLLDKFHQDLEMHVEGLSRILDRLATFVHRVDVGSELRDILENYQPKGERVNSSNIIVALYVTLEDTHTHTHEDASVRSTCVYHREGVK